MKRYSQDMQIHKLVSELVKDGWSYVSKNRHGKLQSPRGKKISIPSTPSDYRASENFKGDINREMRQIELGVPMPKGIAVKKTKQEKVADD